MLFLHNMPFKQKHVEAPCTYLGGDHYIISGGPGFLLLQYYLLYINFTQYQHVFPFHKRKKIILQFGGMQRLSHFTNAQMGDKRKNER